MTRTVADACPGVLRPHRAADGALVRLRLPGGGTTAAALAALTAAALDHADGAIQLTSRGNLQLRGLTVDPAGEVAPALTAAVTAAGFLPSATHERVRNIIASPMTGRRGGLADLRPTVAELDRLLCDNPALANLPGRFLFLLDDGSGDVVGLRGDLGLMATGSESGRLIVGDLLGPDLALAEAPKALIALAESFLAVAGSCWQVRELPLQGRELVPGLVESARGIAVDGLPLGVLSQADGRRLISMSLPFGSLTPAQVAAICVVAGAGSGTLVVTPWRGVIVPDLPLDRVAEAERTLREVGVILDEDSAWAGITACTGSPGCAKAAADVRTLTEQAVAGVAARPPLGRQVPLHVVACERRCGSPSGPHIEVLADDDGLTATWAGRSWRVDTIEAVFPSRTRK